ncbi:MerR family transcriptional regulator [Inmirania thermothiophila]|uniref:DNA-binding transcriptional MerR regulator n=1 Tax=Inmirania thermothiophila TaxID=1750597 RepID=A0A3N1Y0R6_9GAMM|nr:MerR family DNA-binding transcriptional regulator [Inmirania thermothiophila]ROR32429.1 DNA-binding transcriptional MerR regulator [Inmirania thermothiophila]
MAKHVRKATKTTYTITELAREFDVTTRAIRFYEDQGLLKPERRGRNRVYSKRDRVRLKLILRGKRLGFTLQETRELFDLYDSAPSGELAQMRYFLRKIRERRAILLQQRQDIEVVLSELDAIEKQCRQRLAEMGVAEDEAPAAPAAEAAAEA